MNVWIASSNKGKIREFKEILSYHTSFSLDFHAQSEISYYTPPPETGDSFEANARIKVRSICAIKKACWVVADDSGLEVEGLNYLPGVHSARYAGPRATDKENIDKLLKMIHLRCPTQRQAQFRCVIVASSPTDQEFVVEGTLRGHIIPNLRGTKGFGYDSVFVPQGKKHTLAEMELAEKNQISHRGIALRQLAKKWI